jgi:transposase-like protein
MTREERRAHWRTTIDNQAASGMSIAAYCRDAQIKPSYFYTWRRRLREQQPCAGGFLELIPGRLTEVTSGCNVAH